jgi:hypothetical protein
MKDWAHPAVFTYVKICDKSRPDKSLVHLIAKRAGLETADIDCCEIPLTLPYAKLTKNIWAELSSLATAYRCHLECAPEKPLVFAHSPYQTETLITDDVSYSFSGGRIYYLRTTAMAEKYRNTVRMKINVPVSLERQEIWRYVDAPVLYDGDVRPYYPFRANNPREIEHGGYEARYVVKDDIGNERAVIYADLVDTKEEAENRLQFSDGEFHYSAYDVGTYHDRALVTLGKEQADNNEQSDVSGGCNLLYAGIYGRPVVLDLNRSCFMRDDADVARFGTCALNVSGSYFSTDDVNGRPQYEDRVCRELAERLARKREFTIKTHRAVFHARIGAAVDIVTKAGTARGVINALAFHFKRGEAFRAGFRIKEEGYGV